MYDLYTNGDICQNKVVGSVVKQPIGAVMAFFRKFAWLAGLVILACDPLATLFTFMMVRRASDDLDDGTRGSADPQSPDAYDSWPTQLIPIPRMPNTCKMQTTELVMKESDYAAYTKAEIPAKKTQVNS